jgi:hypothetical protein
MCAALRGAEDVELREHCFVEEDTQGDLKKSRYKQEDWEDERQRPGSKSVFRPTMKASV